MDAIYPWHLLATQIAAAYGMSEDSELQMATELNEAIQTGLVQCWSENGDPIRGPIPLEDQRRWVPHLTIAEGNAWLERQKYLQKWEPVVAVMPTTSTSPDFSVLATRQQLIDAFGGFTGMNDSWFKNLKDSPKLKGARKVVGQGARGQTTEPLFCPYQVMLWLVDPKRRKGRGLSSNKGWQLLESHFPKAYNQFSVGDTRTD